MSRYEGTLENLPEVLSEMYLFDRRGYIVGSALQKAIIPLLDQLDSSVKQKVDTVWNRGGCLMGFDTGDNGEKRAEIWCRNFM